MGIKMQYAARGYIASGEYHGNRTPQHIQNQIVKQYCDAQNLNFVLSRAEYWINGNTKCQLWAALKEGFKHIVFFSFLQLPLDEKEREEVYKYCLKNGITLHFATERISTDAGICSFADLELLMKSRLLMTTDSDSNNHLDILRELI